MNFVIYRSRDGSEWKLVEEDDPGEWFDSRNRPMRLTSRCEGYTHEEAREVLRQLKAEALHERRVSRLWLLVACLSGFFLSIWWYTYVYHPQW